MNSPHTPVARPGGVGHSRWRVNLLVVAGLGGAVTLLFREGRGGYALLGARWPIERLPFPWVQLVLCVAVAFGLAALAAWELRGEDAGRSTGFGQRSGGLSARAG